MADKKSLVVSENIETKILTIRGQKVMLDADLAELYGVETKRLNEQVRRNIERFPEDFMFQLTSEELADLRYQISTSNNPIGRGGRRYLPYVFTEHGALMLGNVLKSERAVEVSLHVVRVFVHLRELVFGHKELAQKLNQLERKVGAHDRAIAELINQKNAVEDEYSEYPIRYADSVGANLFAYNSLSVRINSHLQTPQLRFLGLTPSATHDAIGAEEKTPHRLCAV